MLLRFVLPHHCCYSKLQLKIDVDYRLHFYFYDKRAKIFFGRPYYTKWKRPENETLSINEVHFFDELSIKKMLSYN